MSLVFFWYDIAGETSLEEFRRIVVLSESGGTWYDANDLGKTSV
jgi:hypothetical protein